MLGIPNLRTGKWDIAVQGFSSNSTSTNTFTATVPPPWSRNGRRVCPGAPTTWTMREVRERLRAWRPDGLLDQSLGSEDVRTRWAARRHCRAWYSVGSAPAMTQ